MACRTFNTHTRRFEHLPPYSRRSKEDIAQKKICMEIRKFMRQQFRVQTETRKQQRNISMSRTIFNTHTRRFEHLPPHSKRNKEDIAQKNICTEIRKFMRQQFRVQKETRKQQRKIELQAENAAKAELKAASELNKKPDKPKRARKPNRSKTDIQAEKADKAARRLLYIIKYNRSNTDIQSEKADKSTVKVNMRNGEILTISWEPVEEGAVEEEQCMSVVSNIARKYAVQYLYVEQYGAPEEGKWNDFHPTSSLPRLIMKQLGISLGSRVSVVNAMRDIYKANVSGELYDPSPPTRKRSGRKASELKNETDKPKRAYARRRSQSEIEAEKTEKAARKAERTLMKTPSAPMTHLQRWRQQ
jgi:hypothetical protein